MFRVLIIMVATLVSVASCKTKKVTTETETQTTQTIQTEKVDKVQKSESLSEQVQEEKRSVNTFNYDFILKSQDTTQPARLTEYRDGKPYRSLEVHNAYYSEGKSVKDSIDYKKYKELSSKFEELQQHSEQQKTDISQLKKEVEKLTIEGNKLANNFKYALWVLFAIALIWICERSGLFIWFKRLLKRV